MKKYLWILLLLLCTTAYGADVPFTDGEGINSQTVSGATFEVSCEEATDSNLGCAAFTAADFDTASGVVSIDTTNFTCADITTTDCGAITSNTTITAANTFDVTGAVGMTLGSVDVTSITLTTDGTGTGEIILPLKSIAGTEIADDTIDSINYAADSIDNEHINWADIDNLADEGALVVVDTTDTSSYVGLFESATGSLAPKTDLGIVYNAGTGTLSVTAIASTFTGNITGNVTGNASTATALAADPTTCTNQFVRDIAANGTLSCATVVDADVANDLTINSTSQITTTAGIDLGTSQVIDGTTGLTLGTNSITVAVASSVWDIDATGIATGFGNITSSGTVAASALTGTLTGNVTGDLTGNADTATALAANGGNCSAGSYPLGVNASGAVESCTDASTEIDSIVATHTSDNDAHQDLVTVAGTPDYITLTDQVLTRTKLDIDADTNLVAGTNITLTTNTLAVDNPVVANLTGDVTGNADTATALETARTIAGVSFDGTANIDISLDGLSDVATSTATSGHILQADGSNWNSVSQPREICFIIDGGGSAITTGAKAWVRANDAFTITTVDATADQSGSIVVDLWKDTYANFPPTDADSITSAAPPTITTAVKSQDSTLTGWTTAVSEGDYIRANVDSITTIEMVEVCIYGTAN
ncbi:MAG: hypothetical protein U9O94_01435 [Nanoarchaeota archaeon]|nr:hypothetical protein [Nanoarchaeota archaeon]